MGSVVNGPLERESNEDPAERVSARVMVIVVVVFVAAVVAVAAGVFRNEADFQRCRLQPDAIASSSSS